MLLFYKHLKSRRPLLYPIGVQNKGFEGTNHKRSLNQNLGSMLCLPAAILCLSVNFHFLFQFEFV